MHLIQLYAMLCYINDMLCICYEMLRILSAIRWKIYDMVCYGILWKLNKTVSTHRKFSKISRYNDFKKNKFTTNTCTMLICVS